MRLVISAFFIAVFDGWLFDKDVLLSNVTADNCARYFMQDIE